MVSSTRVKSQTNKESSYWIKGKLHREILLQQRKRMRGDERFNYRALTTTIRESQVQKSLNGVQ